MQLDVASTQISPWYFVYSPDMSLRHNSGPWLVENGSS